MDGLEKRCAELETISLKLTRQVRLWLLWPVAPLVVVVAAVAAGMMSRHRHSVTVTASHPQQQCHGATAASSWPPPSPLSTAVPAVHRRRIAVLADRRGPSPSLQSIAVPAVPAVRADAGGGTRM